jgi:hypothetical protein
VQRKPNSHLQHTSPSQQHATPTTILQQQHSGAPRCDGVATEGDSVPYGPRDIRPRIVCGTEPDRASLRSSPTRYACSLPSEHAATMTGSRVPVVSDCSSVGSSPTTLPPPATSRLHAISECSAMLQMRIVPSSLPLHRCGPSTAPRTVARQREAGGHGGVRDGDGNAATQPHAMPPHRICTESCWSGR